jgi:hypothetical protein
MSCPAPPRPRPRPRPRPAVLPAPAVGLEVPVYDAVALSEAKAQFGVVTYLAALSDDPQQRDVRVEVPTSYEALHRFSTHLTVLIKSEVAEAHLDVDVIA